MVWSHDHMIIGENFTPHRLKCMGGGGGGGEMLASLLNHRLCLN